MKLTADILFLAVTRPSMIAGVTTDFLIGNGMTTAFIYIAAKNPLWLLLFIPLHGIAWVLCRNEPRMLSLIGQWTRTKGACPNRFYWHASSYTPLQPRRGRKPNVGSN